jgi:Flp pilus assembly protein TadG
MRVRRHGERRSGAAAVEMAMILPLFVALVFGTIEATRLGMAAQLITMATREGCRVAVLAGMTQTDVQNRIDTVLAGSGIPTTFTISPAITTTTPSGGTAITVSMSVPFSQITWLSNGPYFTNTTLAASATMSSERP